MKLAKNMKDGCFIKYFYYLSFWKFLTFSFNIYFHAYDTFWETPQNLNKRYCEISRLSNHSKLFSSTKDVFVFPSLNNCRNYPYYVTTFTAESGEKPLPKIVLKVNKEKKSKTEGSSTTEEHGHHKKKKKKHKHKSEEVRM